MEMGLPVFRVSLHSNRGLEYNQILQMQSDRGTLD